MYHRILPLLLLSALHFSNCQSDASTNNVKQGDPSPANSSVQKELQAFLENYYQTMSERDWKAYKNLFWDNATLTTTWQKPGESVSAVHVTTIQDFIAQTPQGPDSQPIFEEKMQSSEIDVRGNLAQAWVKFSAKFGSTDQLHEWEGVDLFSLMKLEEEWRIVSLVYE